ncbi:hypothetical protein B0H14DRAFT_2654516 [Mycena olivaceomarginata]|nr:hypothetical protein B0H14DRAFT_2654516 [Mycena olivaceomarginata]
MGRVGKSCDDRGIRRCTHYVQLVIDEEIKGLKDFPGVWAIQCPMAYLKKDSYFWLGWKKLKDRQAAIRPLITGIQTHEQVTDLIQSLEDLHQHNIDEAWQDQIMDPPVISHKGRPRTNHLTNAREGRQRRGGTRLSGRMQAQRTDPAPSTSRVGRAYKCSLCRQEGHNRSNCPL